MNKSLVKDKFLRLIVYEKAAEFVEPEGTINAFGLCSDENGCLAGDGDRVFAVWGLGIVVM